MADKAALKCALCDITKCKTEAMMRSQWMIQAYLSALYNQMHNSKLWAARGRVKTSWRNINLSQNGNTLSLPYRKSQFEEQLL